MDVSFQDRVKKALDTQAVSFPGIARVARRRLRDRASRNLHLYRMKHRAEEGTLVLEMMIKRTSRDIRFLHDLLDRNGAITMRREKPASACDDEFPRGCRSFFSYSVPLH